jgi:hypothetical protein
MGHALNNTMQDVLCRFERMRGRDVLWQPEPITPASPPRCGSSASSWSARSPPAGSGPGKVRRAGVEWKAESGGIIVNQLKRLGASCDWSRERFTMDEGLSKAVVKVFVELYNEGLIYKDKRLVNWDPKLLTAISDLEVLQVECRGSFRWSREDNIPLDLAAFAKAIGRVPNGHLYYFDYPIADGAGEIVTVATTRPETMLGDTAVAVHPENERLKHLIGKTAVLPLVGRRIKIVGDDYADPEKGTGAVKITPAHDFNDFEVGRRHHLAMVNVFDTEAKITPQGFVVKMTVPFRSLRFASNDPQTWGILLNRNILRNNESSFWPQYSSRVSGRLNQEGDATGLENISPGHNFQLIPYGIFRSFRDVDLRDVDHPKFTQRDAFGQIGLDAKAVLKDNFVLDATANPDFSQIESDDPQITVNQRFEVQFPEKRPFFLENSNYFQTPIPLLFTRRIVDPQWGVRLTGKDGPWAVGMLVADDASPGAEVAHDNSLFGKHAYFAVGRVSRDIGNQSSLGLMFTDREVGPYFNRVGASMAASTSIPIGWPVFRVW